MALLNELTAYHQVATELSNSMFYNGDTQSKELLPNGTNLFRFSRHRSATLCEWWMLFDRFVLSDQRLISGFADFLHATGSRLGINGNFIAKGDLKLTCANPTSRIELVRLNQAVYAFAGSTSPQRPDPCEPELPLVGGEFRVWIPGLGASMANRIAIPSQFIVQPAAPESASDAPPPAPEAGDTRQPAED